MNMVYKAAMAMLRATSRAWVQALGSKICIVCMTWFAGSGTFILLASLEVSFKLLYCAS